jgi:hypothetical protein
VNPSMTFGAQESFCCPELGSKQISLPIQVLQLPSLEGVLNRDTWNSLTKEEQDKLAAVTALAQIWPC